MLRSPALLWLLLAPALAGCGDNLSQPPEHDPYGTGDAGPLSCVPNLDGRIDAAELRPALGLPVKYLVSPAGEERKVDVAGEPGKDGTRLWTFSADYASDKVATLEAAPLKGRWYAGSFPDAEFTSPLDAAGTIDGIYTADDESISLLGLASHDESPPDGKTLVVYDQPIAVFLFPLEPGKKWVSTGTVTDATLKGLPYAGKDVYEVTDDALGALQLHDFTFTEAHRVRTKVTVSPATGASTFERQVSFVFECFGEVTRVTSRPDETEENFTTAAEMRRLGQ